MGLLSSIRNAVSSAVSRAPGGRQVQRAVGRDPVAQTMMRYDPAAKELAEAHGLVAQKPATAAVVEEAQQSTMPVRSNGGWQRDRMAALRARFSRLPQTAAPAATPATTVAQPVTATPPQQPATSTAVPAAAPINRAAQDVESYSRHWGNGNNTY